MSIASEVSCPTVTVLIFSSWFSARRYSVYNGCARESRGPTRPLGSGEGSGPGRSDLSRSHRTAGHDEPSTLIPGSERTESLDTQIHLSDDVRDTMTGKSQHGLVMIRSSHEDLSDPTSHLLLPTDSQGP